MAFLRSSNIFFNFNYLAQLLNNENLDQSWAKILVPLCARVANSLRPDLCGMMDPNDPRNLMDIRHFVNFKKVPGNNHTISVFLYIFII